MNILVVVAHPDDEVLGAGGAIAKHVVAGDKVGVLILADGVGSRNGDPLQRLAECHRAAKVMGCSLMTCAFDDQKLATYPLLQITRIIEFRIRELKPEAVYTHWMGDLNQDHRVVSEATQVACRPVNGCSVKRLLYMEPPRQLVGMPPFAPNACVDITDHLVTKIKALECYDSELREFPHPMSANAIMHNAHGHGSQIGCDSAEAFMLGMEIR